MAAVAILGRKGWTVAEVADHEDVESLSRKGEDVLSDGFDSVIELHHDLKSGEGGQVGANGGSHWTRDHIVKVQVAAFKQNSSFMVGSISSGIRVEVGHVELKDPAGDG